MYLLLLVLIILNNYVIREHSIFSPLRPLPLHDVTCYNTRQYQTIQSLCTVTCPPVTPFSLHINSCCLLQYVNISVNTGSELQ